MTDVNETKTPFNEETKTPFINAETSLFQILAVGKTRNVITNDLSRVFLPVIYEDTVKEITAVYTKIAAEGKYILTAEEIKTAAEKRYIHYHHIENIICGNIPQLARKVAERQKALLGHIIGIQIILVEIYEERGGY